MRKKLVLIVIVIFVLVSILVSCNIPSPAKPDFVWNGFECRTVEVNGIGYVSIIGLTPDIVMGDYFIFPAAIDGYKVLAIGRIRSLLESEQSYSEYFNYSFEGVDKIFIPIMNVSVFQKLKGNGSPLKIICLDGEDSSGNLKDHHVFVPFGRHGEYGLRRENQYKANISFKYNFEEDMEEPNYGYYWIDHLEDGEKLTVIPNDPQREGYDFDGWYMEAECMNAADFEEFTKENVEEETIFYARWKEKI